MTTVENTGFYAVDEDLDDMIACVTRELGMRAKVYPRWIEKGRMTQAKADHETNTMQAVFNTLLRIKQDSQLL